MAHLVLYFNSKKEYERAKRFFEGGSDFYADETCDEMHALYFEEELELTDALEEAITEELVDRGLDNGGFHFDVEFY